jgi:hypothetical protein
MPLLNIFYSQLWGQSQELFFETLEERTTSSIKLMRSSKGRLICYAGTTAKALIASILLSKEV